jgi:hypothetical protein
VLSLRGVPFAGGRARYLDSAPGGRGAKIVIKLELEGLADPLTAHVDTGAEWSMIHADVAADLGLLDLEGETVSISTRVGRIRGKLVRHAVRLLADEGESLDMETTLFVASDWRQGNFLGYRGCLEFLRFAFDPGARDFYFGRF